MVPSQTTDHTKRIAILNDAFRMTFMRGMVCISAAVHERGENFVVAALRAVKQFDAFTPDNDPYHEHDFGAFEIEGQKLFWKIDYYDPSLLNGSEDPANVEVTRRVLTVMFAEEY